MALLCVLDVIIGGWALFAPLAFYQGFPGGPFRWISPFGSYSMHLIADVGGAYLMMAALLMLAAINGGRGVIVLALVAVGVQATIHLVWHLIYLSMITNTGTLNVSGLVVILAIALALPATLLVLSRRL